MARRYQRGTRLTVYSGSVVTEGTVIDLLGTDLFVETDQPVPIACYGPKFNEVIGEGTRLWVPVRGIRSSGRRWGWG